jgi:hypothetical protein
MPPEDQEQENGEAKLKKAANQKRKGPVPGGPKDLEDGPANEMLLRLDVALNTLIERRLRLTDTVSERLEGEMWMKKRSKKKLMFTLRPA